MKLLLSLDYELFFGANTGTVEKCLLTPIAALLERVEKKGVKLSLFVDAIFLLRLRDQASRFTRLQHEYDAIRRHLERLNKTGHDIQLHLHPHWLDSRFDGTRWHVDTSRYRLHDYTAEAMSEIVRSGKNILAEISGADVFAFRGGGWCIQPFEKIAASLMREGIWLESTVFFGGASDDPTRWYDFQAAPIKDYWRFTDDPNQEEDSGPFLEVPISSFSAGPLLFWRMGLAKKIGGERHRSFGDGVTMTANSGYYLRRLTSSTRSVVSIDGLKADMLKGAYQQNVHAGNKQLFHVMGHPKSLTRYSIARFGDFIDSNPFESITFQDLVSLKNY